MCCVLCIALGVGGWILNEPQLSNAATWYVDAEGNADFDLVSEALNFASAGDSVLVHPGTYQEDCTEDVLYIREKPIYFAGLGATPGETTLSGFEIWVLNSAGTVFENLRMSDSGGALVISSEMSIRSCIFSENDGTRQCAAVQAVGAAELISVEDSIFSENTVPSVCGEGFYGAALHLQYQVGEVRRCIFLRNHAADMGAGVVGSNREATITDCLFVENVAPHGPAISTPGESSGLLTIERCTFWKNRTTSPSGAIFVMAHHWTVRNSIIAGTVNGWGIAGPGFGEAFCCDFWGNERGVAAGGCITCTPEYGNIFVDPQFCDAEAGNFNLNPSSPCLPGYQNGYYCERMGAFGSGCDSTLASTPEITEGGAALSAMRYRDGLGISVSPNPSFGPIQLQISITEPTHARVGIYDVAGRKVLEVAEEDLAIGTHRYWLDDVTELGTATDGVYYAVVRAGDRHVSQAFVILER